MRIYKPTFKDRQGVTKKSAKFYCEIRTADGRVLRLPGFENQRLTEALGRNVQKLIDCVANHELPTGDLALWVEAIPNHTAEILSRWGLLSGRRLAAGKALADHLADWKAAMLAKGLTEKHVGMMYRDAMRIFTACNAKFISDIQPGKVQAAIAAEKNAGLSLQTCNHLTKAVKAFTRWACRDGRLQTDLLAHLTKFNVRTDRRHDRRALGDAEVNALIAAAESGPYLVGPLLPGQTRPTVGPQTILGVAGPDRAMVYRVAVGTGFRKAEIASLTPESFNLAGQPPTITVKAGFSKHRREDIQPIRQDLADMLRTFIAGKPAGTPVFAMPDKTCKVMQADLASARANYLDDAETVAERAERKQSGFCLYADAAGRYADFHALRHTYITRLVKSNASVKVCQELARHSDPKLTFAVYSHVGMADTSRALDNLPDLDKPQAEKQTALALRTGTDDLPISAVAKPTHGAIPESEARWARYWARDSIRTKNPVESIGVLAMQGQGEEKPLSVRQSCDSQGDNENAPAGIRTRNIPLRRRMLYPIELRARTGIILSHRGRIWKITFLR